MTRNAKIALSILGGLVVVCLCAGALAAGALTIAGRKVAQTIVVDPEQAAQVANNITEYDLPAGYKQEAMRILGFNLVTLAPEQADGAPVILMMQFPAGANLDQKQMEEQMQRSMQMQFMGQGLSLKLIGQQDIKIRGEDATLTIREGQNSDGTKIRQATAQFTGNEGEALLMIMGPKQTWDQTLVDTFIQSMR